jgi:uncharacterized protein (TIGR04141 family)
MSNKIKTNRLSIYLIKLEFDTADKILKDINSVTAHKLSDDESSILYTKDSFIRPPQWIEKFFLKSPDDFNLKNSSSQALYLIKIKVDNNNDRYFAIPFGVGYHLLKPGVIEERFGLKVVLNTVDEKQLRSIDKKNMSNVPKQSREQISANSIVADFGIDIEQDLILGVTGKTKNEDFGKTITGKDALKVSIRTNINTIHNFLKKCYEQYKKEDYKTNFGWIDQIAEIKSKIIINKLNEKLIEKVKIKEFEKLWMAIPEIIDWEDVEGFCYSYDKNADKLDDIFIQSFLDGIYADENYNDVSLDTFTKKQIFCFSSSTENVIHQWKAYKCLYCEIEENEKTYLLTNGKWYEIQTDFVKQINKEYEELLTKTCNLDLPDYKHENEGDYNKKVAENENSLCLMDKKNISYGGGYSKIEFCDLYSKNKEMIHVKIYGGSSMLSHLFNQGLVAGELFKAEKEFRDKVNSKLEDEFKLSDTSNINPTDYKVIYAIISHVKKDLNIPFFSKVSLKNAKKRLETIGYNVFLMKIKAENRLKKEVVKTDA